MSNLVNSPVLAIQTANSSIQDNQNNKKETSIPNKV